MAAPRPSLDADQFERAFPFHVHVDSGLNIVGMGRSLERVCGPVQGRALDSVIACRRPRQARCHADWLAHAGKACVLTTLTEPKMTLRGDVQQMVDGSLLFVLAPVFAQLEDIHTLGLAFSDFAAHDTLGDMLLVNRAAQMTLADAQHLAERLRLRSAQLDTIMELSSNGVAYLNPLQQVDYINSALAGMLGRPRGSLIGRAVEDLDALLDARIGAPDRPRGALQALLAAHPLPQQAVSLQLDQPAKRVLQVSVRASPEGGCVLYFRDVTYETEVDRMKSEFLSTAAHELRTPMASVYGFSELLLRRDFPPERQRDMLATIHRQSAILIDLINELLDLARIEARRGQDFKRRLQPIGPIVEQAIKGLLVPGDGRQVKLSVEQPEALVTVDESKIGQAIVNVLSNAYKYSPEGGEISLSCRLQPAGEPSDAGPQVLIEVQDQGIGMTPAQLARLFERFYRADPSGTIPGTGLGMCLVKEIVELHGGRVDVHSEWQAGTRVRLFLPLETAGADAQSRWDADSADRPAPSRSPADDRSDSLPAC